MFSLKTLASALFISQASAHFFLQTPPTIGFDDDKEASGPCGGFTANLSNTTDFYVGGDAIQVLNTHPTTTFLFRITTNANATGNFTALRQPIQQSGLGKMCQPAITVPASFVGQKGVLQVVADSPDGLLYQCAALNFIAGSTTRASSLCSNQSGVTAAYVSDTTLTNLGSSSGNSSSTNASRTSTASTVASATSRAAAPGPVAKMGAEVLGAALMVGIAGLVGVACLF